MTKLSVFLCFFLFQTLLFATSFEISNSNTNSYYKIFSKELKRNSNDITLCLKELDNYFTASVTLIKTFPEESLDEKKRLKATINYLIKTTDLFYGKFKETKNIKYLEKAYKCAEYLISIKSNLIEKEKCQQIIDEYQFNSKSNEKSDSFNIILNCLNSSTTYSKEYKDHLIQAIKFKMQYFSFLSDKDKKSIDKIIINQNNEFISELKTLQKQLNNAENVIYTDKINIYYDLFLAISDLKYSVNSNTVIFELISQLNKTNVEKINTLKSKVNEFIKQNQSNFVFESVDLAGFYKDLNYSLSLYQNILRYDIFSEIKTEFPDIINLLNKTQQIMGELIKALNLIKEQSYQELLASLHNLQSLPYQEFSLDLFIQNTKIETLEKLCNKILEDVKNLIAKNNYIEALQAVNIHSTYDFSKIQNEKLISLQKIVCDEGYKHYLDLLKNAHFNNLIEAKNLFISAIKFKETPEAKEMFHNILCTYDKSLINTVEEFFLMAENCIPIENNYLVYNPPLDFSSYVGKQVYFSGKIEKFLGNDLYLLFKNTQEFSTDQVIVHIPQNLIKNKYIVLHDNVFISGTFINVKEGTTLLGKQLLLSYIQAECIVK